jgi:hypothetical protein
MRQQSTSRLLTVACSAMWSALRPMSFTSPTRPRRALGFHVRRGDGPLRRLHRRVEPEGAVDDAHVVVHRLRDAGDGHGDAQPPDPLEDPHQAAHRAVAADGVHLVEPAPVNGVSSSSSE